METAIRICIGTEPCTEIPRKVLQHSILQHAGPDAKLEFHLLTDGEELAPLGAATGFSCQRWCVPEVCNYQGRAIYLDADQVVFSDIRELWEIDRRYVNEKTCAWCTYRDGRPESSVMLIDCEKAREQWPTMAEIAAYILADGAPGRRQRYRSIMRGAHLVVPLQEIDVSWNRLNEYVPGETNLLHFTYQPTQPWRHPDHEYAHVWQEALLSAVRAGDVSKEEVMAACREQEPGSTQDPKMQMDSYWARCIERA